MHSNDMILFLQLSITTLLDLAAPFQAHPIVLIMPGDNNDV